MAQGILINDFRPEYSENLFPVKALFDEALTVNLTEGLASFDFLDEESFAGGKSLFCFLQSYKTTNIAFNFGSDIITTIKNTGNHIFSFRMLNANTTVEFFPAFVIYAKVWVNGINTDDIEFHMVSDPTTYSKKWVSFCQSINLTKDDEVNFSFYVDADLSYPFNNIGFYIDGLKLEYDDRFLGTPSIYSRPLEQITENATGYQSRTDTINTQVLTGLTDNLVSFTGVLEENGGLTLMDSNCKITPIQQGDVLVLDFAFDCVAPIGSDNFLVISLKVDGVVYRNINMPIVKGAGLVDNFSVSWSLPIGASFLANGGEVYINPNTAITISNRYMVVSRTHKAV